MDCVDTQAPDFGLGHDERHQEILCSTRCSNPADCAFRTGKHLDAGPVSIFRTLRLAMPRLRCGIVRKHIQESELYEGSGILPRARSQLVDDSQAIVDFSTEALALARLYSNEEMGEITV